RRLGLEQRQLCRSELFCTAFNFPAQTIFSNISATNALRMFLQVFEDAIDLPATADIVPYNGVKYIAAVSTRRRTFTHDQLNVIDAVFASSAVEAISFDWSFLFCRFTPLTPHQSPIKYLVDVAQFTNCRIKRIAGDRQCFVGFTK